MMRVVSGAGRGIALAGVVVVWMAAEPATAVRIWERAGPFQACVESRFTTWVNARAEQIANEDPKATDVDDAAVAKWTVETLSACRAQIGGGDKESEAHFARYMAHWRQHIDDAVRTIQDKVRPD